MRSGAAETLRGIFWEIRALPDRPAQTPKVVPYGDLDAIASLAEASKRRPGGVTRPTKLSMAAGERYGHYSAFRPAAAYIGDSTTNSNP